MSAIIETGTLHDLLSFPKNKPEWREKAELALLGATCTAKYSKNDMYLAGSTAINGHGNDLDVVLRCDDLEEAANALSAAGWEVVAAEVYRGVNSDGWFSARLGDVNLLVSEWHIVDLWRIATDVCKAYAVLMQRETTRAERVHFHKAVFND